MISRIYLTRNGVPYRTSDGYYFYISVTESAYEIRLKYSCILFTSRVSFDTAIENGELDQYIEINKKSNITYWN